MKCVLQKGNPFLTFYFGLMAVLILQGCPKKVAPLGKGATTPPKSADSRPLPGGTSAQGGNRTEEEARGQALPPSVYEDEIPLSSGANTASPLAPTTADPTAAKTDLGDLFFDFGQWTVRPADMPLIEKNAAWLMAHPDKKISIEGHADKRGTNEYNLVLAEKRAQAVQESLIQRGVPSSRILVESYGEERPFCGMDNETCFQENRRAHFNAE